MSARAIEGKEEGRTQESPRVDRLSLLPPELLEIIFEHTYSDYRLKAPKAPLSKHLKPFFLKHFHRRIRLRSSTKVESFLNLLSQLPERGKWVTSLSFDRGGWRVVKSIEVLEALFLLLPQLVEVEISVEQAGVGPRTAKLFSTLTKVKTVSTEPSLEDDLPLDLAQFAFLASLPSLSNLLIYEWPPAAEPQEEESFKLRHVTYLRLEGGGVDEDSICELVDLCPSLLSVEIYSTHHQDYLCFSTSVRCLPSKLNELKLECKWAHVEGLDDELARLTQLRTLKLKTGGFSNTIHTTLVQLPLLEVLYLGQSTISPSGFLPLVSGPSRLVNLKSLTLDFDIGQKHKRQRATYESYQENPNDYDNNHDWVLPEPLEHFEVEEEDDDDEGEEPSLEYFGGLREVIELARAHGIVVTGSVDELLANVEDYWFEAGNRAMLGIFSVNQDFRHLRRIRKYAHRSGVSLPPLDVDSLNRNQLELVKIESANRDWIVYTLKDAVGGTSKDENGVEVGAVVEWL